MWLKQFTGVSISCMGLSGAGPLRRMVLVGLSAAGMISVFACTRGVSHGKVEPDSTLAKQPVIAKQGTPSSAIKKSVPKPAPEGISDETGQPVHPMSVLSVKDDLYFLGPDCLWVASNAQATLESIKSAGKSSSSKPSIVTTCVRLPARPPENSKDPKDKTFITNIVHEFSDFCYYAPAASIAILDKSGDLYSFEPTKRKWNLLRLNVPSTGSPDPEYIGFCAAGAELSLLDPERNQIWRMKGKNPQLIQSFREVLPWQLRSGNPNVSDGIGIAYDKEFFVLNHSGSITKFGGKDKVGHLVRMPFAPNAANKKDLSKLRPSRIYTQADSPLLVVERENNRVIAIEKSGRASKPFVFNADCDLRGLMLDQTNEGFFIVNGKMLEYRSFAEPDTWQTAISPRRIDERLEGLSMPIAGASLPRHAGVFPGARRLYRFGVHEGLDLFYDGASKTKVQMGTPAIASDAGKVARADAKFKDMDQATFSRVMFECRRDHKTSDANENLFRGCQVWIDHGNQLMTRYAHLSKINQKLKVKDFVKRGDLVGYVGVSGTGQNLPGHAKYPHLHFEIWLDGKYLGWGLTPAETRGVFEDIFGAGG